MHIIIYDSTQFDMQLGLLRIWIQLDRIDCARIDD